MKLAILLGRRIGNGAALLLAVLVLNFILLHLAPGDVADTIVQDMGGADAEVIKEIREKFALDRPFYVQIGIYFGRLAQGDLGYSYFFQVPVTSLILERLWATLLLVVSAQILSISLGTVLGVMAARKPNGILNHIVSVLALLGYAAPVFWTGIMLIILFCSIVPIFPLSGMQDILVEGNWFIQTGDVLYHLILPTLTLSSIYIALYSRLARASMLDVLGSDYIRTARAKGLPETTVIYKHGLRNALSPVITLAGLQFSTMMSGAVLVETVFSWPGLGTLALQAILARDTPTILGILFFAAFVVIVANLITDLLYTIVDPRIKLGSRDQS